MATLAIVMTLEKMSVSKRFSRALGVALIGIGVVVFGADIAARLGL
jgi:hypothetical protein